MRICGRCDSPIGPAPLYGCWTCRARGIQKWWYGDMSYEECPIHHDDATNGCRQCKCKDCGGSQYEHTFTMCQANQIQNLKKKLNDLYGQFGEKKHPPGVICLHCKSWNQPDAENASYTCWKCHGELPPIEVRKGNNPSPDVCLQCGHSPKHIGICKVCECNLTEVQYHQLERPFDFLHEKPDLNQPVDGYFGLGQGKTKQIVDNTQKYSKSIIVQLRLEKKVVEAAQKWWKIEDWNNDGNSDLNIADSLKELVFELLSK